MTLLQRLFPIKEFTLVTSLPMEQLRQRFEEEVDTSGSFQTTMPWSSKSKLYYGRFDYSSFSVNKNWQKSPREVFGTFIPSGEQTLIQIQIRPGTGRTLKAAAAWCISLIILAWSLVSIIVNFDHPPENTRKMITASLTIAVIAFIIPNAGLQEQVRSTQQLLSRIFQASPTEDTPPLNP
ncbi:MAG: hypothetical protein JST68_22570 [Bacteroidetes bacterium]|nr:hypothetical protein [Bacteroidota bacterium]